MAGTDGPSEQDLFPELQSVLDNWAYPTTGPSDSDVPPEHAGVTDAEIEAFIASRGGRVGPNPAVSGQQNNGPRFTTGGPLGAPTGGIEESDIQIPPAPVVTPEPPVVEPVGDDNHVPPTPVEEIQVGDISIPRERIEAYANFDSIVRDDPRLQQLLASYLSTGTIPVDLVEGSPSAAPQPGVSTPPPTSQLPPEIDLDDPVIRFMYENNQRLEQEIARLGQGLTVSVTQQQARANAEMEGIARRARNSFQQQHNLNDDEIANLELSAARLNVLPSLMSGIDPITGAPVKPDPLAAVERALEIAYNNNPEFRNREFRKWVETRRQDQGRKSRAGALAGSSGSSPRTKPAPRNKQEADVAMRQEVAEMFAGTWSQPE